LDQALDSAACLSLLVSRGLATRFCPTRSSRRKGRERFAVLSCNRPTNWRRSPERRGAHLKLSRGLHLWTGPPQPDSRVHVAILGNRRTPR